MNLALMGSTVAATVTTALVISAVIGGATRRLDDDQASDALFASSTRTPAMLRLFLRLSRPLAWTLTGRLPPRIEVAVTRLLAHAGLLPLLTAAAWVALLAACASTGLASLALVCAWIGLPAAPAWLAPLVPAWAAHSWLKARAAARASTLVKQLPAAIDLLVLCLESGASLVTALRLTYEKSSPGPLQDLFATTLQQIRAGRGRALAFREVMEQFDLPAVTGLMTALIQADARGMSLGPVLRAQSAQCVAERFVKAERAAMQAPVKLLLPLLLCIFPCTFIVIAVPIAARLTSQGTP